MRLIRIVLVAFVVGALPAGAAVGAGTAARAINGTWVGTFVLPTGSQRTGIAITVSEARATVWLPGGHAAETVATARTSRDRLRLQLPGRPTGLRLDGRLRGREIVGTARQAGLRGTFRLRRGTPPDWGTLGLYAFPGGRVMSVIDNPWFPRQATQLESGEIHALFRTGRNAYEIGAALGARAPAVGSAFTRDTMIWRRSAAAEERAARMRLRQQEVRFRSGNAWLAGTLTLPNGAGRHPAVAIVRGAGPVPRAGAGLVEPFFASLGFAVLTYDKRGIGQSGGTYPGESASAPAIDALARDAEAAARFLAAQPEVDRARIGLSGGSQAGWIMPRAATREAAIRFLVLLVGPTLTQGETDLFADLREQQPEVSVEQAEAEVARAGPSGVDPMPWIRALRIPALWLYGGRDRTVPTRLSVARLEPLMREPGRDFSYRIFPGGNHGLIETANGLDAEMLASDRLVPGLYPTIRDWLRLRGIATPADLFAFYDLEALTQ